MFGPVILQFDVTIRICVSHINDCIVSCYRLRTCTPYSVEIKLLEELKFISLPPEEVISK